MSYSFNQTPHYDGASEVSPGDFWNAALQPANYSSRAGAASGSSGIFDSSKKSGTRPCWLDVPVAIAIIDADGKIESVNRETEEMFSSSASELRGRKLSEILELDSVFDIKAGDAVQVRVRDGGAAKKVELTLRLSSDKRIVTLLDVAERLEVQQLRRDFIAMVGHDLRAPLSLVQVSIEMLSNGLFGELSTEAKLQLAKAERSVDRMELLLNDLLDLNRLERTFTIKPTVVEIRALIEAAIESTSALASKNDVRVVYECDAGSCFADGARVVQVLVNLLDNAIKFSPRGRNVVVRSRRRKDHLEISVQDEGRGVPQSMQSRIFERFVQVSHNSRVNAEGCGLGLAICKAIVLNHGGKIGVKSRPGKGSRFWFCLPLDKSGEGVNEDEFLEPSEIDPHEVLREGISFSEGLRSELPMDIYQKCLQEAVREFASRILVAESDVFGMKELREQLRRYLSLTRQIECETDQIVVLPSTEGGLDLLARLMVKELDTVAIEDPCFPGIPMSLSRNVADVVPVPVDREGLSVEELSKLAVVPGLVYVTPSHQDTIGVTMSMKRRLELLEWAGASGSIVVEDDFGCEFTYGKSPMPSLFSISGAGNVIYKHNFWKSLYPLVRVSVMILPQRLVPLFRSAMPICNDASFVEHLALALMIERGSYTRHLELQKRNYARRRRALMRALQKWGSGSVDICPTSSGTHLTVRFPGMLDGAAIEAGARAAGLEIISTAGCYIRQKPPVNEYLISFARVDETKVGTQVDQLMSLVLGL